MDKEKVFEELNAQAKRANDNFASVMDIIEMKRKPEREFDNQLWQAYKIGYNRAIDDVINYLLNGKEDNI